MPRIIFVNRFYWPDEPATAQLLTDLATRLAAAGFSVEVITSTAAQAAEEEHAGVRIHRVRRTNNGRGLVSRSVAFTTFLISAAIQLLRRLRSSDHVVAMTDPPLLGVVIWPIVRLRGAKLYHWVQDIYPEIAVTVTGHRWPLLVRPLRDFAWRHSEGCIVVGKDMAQVVSAAVVARTTVTVVPNWAPAGVTPAAAEAVDARRNALGLGGKFIVGYSGNLGRVHDLDPILDVAERLRDDRDIIFVIIGGGARRADLQRRVEASRLMNVRFLPPQPRGELSVSLALSDVHFVTLLPGAEASVFPSKLYGIAQVGRPVIFVGNPRSEIASLVQSEGLGLSYSRNDSAAIAHGIRALAADLGRRNAYGAAARAFACDGFDRAVAAWTDVLAGTEPDH